MDMSFGDVFGTAIRHKLVGVFSSTSMQHSVIELLTLIQPFHAYSLIGKIGSMLRY